MKRRVRAAILDDHPPVLPKNRNTVQRLQAAAYSAKYARNRLSDLVGSLQYLPDIPEVTGYITDGQRAQLLNAIDILDELSTNLSRVAER